MKAEQLKKSEMYMKIRGLETSELITLIVNHRSGAFVFESDEQKVKREDAELGFLYAQRELNERVPAHTHMKDDIEDLDYRVNRLEIDRD